MKSCALVSLAGGQGKTTTTFFLSLLLAQRGKTVLAVDCDPQANLTFYLNHEVATNQPTLFEVLTGAVSTEDGIYPTSYDHLFVLPADKGLFKVSEYLSSSGAGAFILKLRLQKIESLFDYVLIDVQPSRSQLCLSAVGAANHVLIPAEAATKGVNSLMDTLEFLNEQADLMAFTGNVLGIIPFRDRWIGHTQTKESKENVWAMQELVPHIPLIPSIRESEQYKRAIRQGKLLADIGHPDLQYPFEMIIEVLENE
ncbi:MAG: ParA family protein [Snowella sp.]|nr:ParA family protein [Snowella sp.]